MSYVGEICENCGLPVALGIGGSWWEADDDLWAAVHGRPRGVLCPRCFTVQAFEQAIPIHWKAVEGV